MFLLAILVLAIVAVPCTGGRLLALAEVRVRRLWLIGLALGAQIAIITIWPGGSHGWHVATHLATYALAGSFLWSNRRLAGAWLVALGFAANVIVIVANGGVMPASAHAQEIAGIEQRDGAFENSAVVSDARLSFLGDVFAIPDPVPLANVFSVGDMLLGMGAGVFVISSCRRRTAMPAPQVMPPGVDASASPVRERVRGRG